MTRDKRDAGGSVAEVAGRTPSKPSCGCREAASRSRRVDLHQQARRRRSPAGASVARLYQQANRKRGATMRQIRMPRVDARCVDRGCGRVRFLPASPALAQVKPATAAKARAAVFDASACLGCHAPIKALHDMGKHSKVGCDACHDGTAAHLADSSKRPATHTDLATCGGCHQNQYKSYAQMDWRRTARFEKKQAIGPAPDPAVRPADDAARLHEGTQPAARAHVRAARPVCRRPRVRRPLRAEGSVALSRRLGRLQGLGRRRRPVPRQHRPEALQAGHRRGGQPGLPVVQDAGPHPRMGVHGRHRAGRQMEPHVEGGRAGEVGRTIR